MSKPNTNAVVGELMAMQALVKAEATHSLAETMRRLKSLDMSDADFINAGHRLIESQGIMTEDGQVHRFQAPAQAPEPYRAPKSAGMRVAMTGQWEPRLVVKENAAGKSRDVWQVRGSGSNKYEFDFRHEIVATMVAAALNETNNFNDARVLRLRHLFEQETTILIEMRRAKNLVESGKAGAAASLKDLKSQLDGVRRLLGVKS